MSSSTSSSTIPFQRFALALGMLLIATGIASAQGYGQKKPADLPAGSITGDVKGVSNGAIMVSNGKDAYYVRVAPNAKKVDIKGEGDISLLQPGMFLRFDIKMDKQGNGKEDVAKIELFTPDPQIARTGTEPKGGEEYTVAGQLKSINKTGKMIVEAPGDKPRDKVTIRAQVAKDATLDIGVRGGVWLKLAKAGDSATASGKVAKASAPNSPGVLIADEIEVKLVKQNTAEVGKDKPEPKAKAAVPEKKAAKTKEKDKEKDKEKE